MSDKSSKHHGPQSAPHLVSVPVLCSAYFCMHIWTLHFKTIYGTAPVQAECDYKKLHLFAAFQTHCGDVTMSYFLWTTVCYTWHGSVCTTCVCAHMRVWMFMYMCVHVCACVCMCVHVCRVSYRGVGALEFPPSQNNLEIEYGYCCV